MPRKPKREKQQITVIVNGKPVTVVLHPPTGRRRSWYAYWTGLVASRSTGTNDVKAAILAAERMVRHGSGRLRLIDAILSDEEFEQVQRRHFSRQTDPAARARAEKSLYSCLTAIAAFRRISGIAPISLSTADDCASFQTKALSLPKNWRRNYPKGAKDAVSLSPNTVLKWSRSLQAAFERVNRHASKRKCVRGVVDESKLLTQNPWNQFPWIEGKKCALRQFTSQELGSFLDYLATSWSAVTIALVATKMFLWSSARRLEIVGLTWDQQRLVGDEHHFHIVGKWGVERWFRVPEGLYRDALRLRNGPYVFAAYTEQLRLFYEEAGRSALVQQISPFFKPACFGDWFHARVTEWSELHGDSRATPHVFRKTSLQYARSGEDLNRQVADDARLGEAVLMTSYAREADEELRQRSNRTYCRILASMPVELSIRFGCRRSEDEQLQQRIRAACAARDWRLVNELSADLASRSAPPQ